MALSDNHNTLPPGGGASFTKDEWKRSEAAVQKIRDRLAKTCRHLIVSPDPPKKRKVNWAKIEEERAKQERRLQDAEQIARG